MQRCTGRFRLGGMFVLASAILFSCTIPISQKEYEQHAAKTMSSAGVEAERYTSNIVKLYHLFPCGSTARTIDITTTGTEQAQSEENAITPEEFFNSQKIFDADSQPISFVDFSDSDKEQFIAYWAQVTREKLQNDLEATPDLIEAYKNINDIMDETLSETSRNLSDYIWTYQDFSRKYSERYLERRVDRGTVSPSSLSRSSSSGSSPGGSIENVRSLNTNAVAKVRAGYAKGRILISTSGGFGHTSMMTFNTWDPAWETDGGSMIAITSFAAPSGSKTFWGGPDGVQYEPLGVWAGTCEEAAENVKIIQPSNHCWSYYWKWNWFGSRLVTKNWMEDPTGTETDKAVGFALSKIGSWYCIGTDIINNKNPFIGGTYVCSSLVWKSWQYAASGKIELDATWWDNCVTPDNIATTDDRRDIISYSN